MQTSQLLTSPPEDRPGTPATANVISSHGFRTVEVAAARTLDDHSRGIMVPSYIEHTTDGIYIIFETLSDPDDFRKTLDDWFGKNMYIQGFDIKAVEGILFENSPHEERLKIGTELKSIPEDLLGLFGGSIQIGEHDGNARWTYFYQQNLLRNAEFDGLNDEAKLHLIKDMVIAQSWKKGKNRDAIRYGFIPDRIVEGIKTQKNAVIIIAEPKKPIAGKDGCVIEVDLTKKDNYDGRGRKELDIGKLEQRKVENGEVLYNRIPATEGDPGIDVSGNKIPGTPGKDIPLPEYDKDTILYVAKLSIGDALVANKTGFLYVTKLGVLEIRSEITIDEVSMHKTQGGVTLGKENSGEVTGDVMKPIKDAKELTIRGSVYSTIQAEGSVTVDGNVIGSSKAVSAERVGTDGVSRAKITIHESGRIEAGGDITVGGNVESAYISSNNGICTFKKRISGSHISAKKVIGTRAIGSLIVGDHVELEEAENCVIIANHVHVKHVGENVSIVYLLPEVTAESTRELEEEIAALTNNIKAKYTEYMTVLITACKTLFGDKVKEYVIGTGERIVGAFNILEDPNSPKEDKTKLIQQLQKNGLNTTMLRYSEFAKLKKESDKLTLELEEIRALPEKARGGIDISLGNINSYVKIKEGIFVIGTESTPGATPKQYIQVGINREIFTVKGRSIIAAGDATQQTIALAFQHHAEKTHTHEGESYVLKGAGLD